MINHTAPEHSWALRDLDRHDRGGDRSPFERREVFPGIVENRYRTNVSQERTAR